MAKCEGELLLCNQNTIFSYGKGLDSTRLNHQTGRTEAKTAERA